jgi:hypothetical protein
MLQAQVTRQAADTALRQQLVASVLAAHANAAHQPHLVQPRFLFMDTNCYLNMLPIVEQLACDARFSLMVPLVVVNELHGLRRGARSTPLPSLTDRGGNAAKYDTPAVISMEDGKHGAKGRKTAAAAAAALTFLEAGFAPQSACKFRAVTGVGTVM